MLTYNSRLKKLVLPEYGRHIHNMVEHCMTLEDRNERNDCAAAIVDAMRTILPPTGDAMEYERKLWDHLIIMSDFKLDIDTPFESVMPDTFDHGPEPIPVEHTGALPFRHYGRLIPTLIETASRMEDGEERSALITLIANQMKKTLLADNPEGVDDNRILKDLRYMSRGNILVDAESIHLQDFKHAPTPSGRKKRKK